MYDKAIELYKGGLSIAAVSKETGIPSTSLHRYLKKMGISRPYSQSARKYDVDHTFFDEIRTEEQAYWLGFMYADGYITQQGTQKKVGLALGAVDAKHLEKLNKALKSTYEVKTYEQFSYGKQIYYARLLITSPQLFDALESKGVNQNKSLILEFPGTDILPQSLVRHFIRGYFDGDGSFSKNGPSQEGFQFKLCGTAELLSEVARQLGFPRATLFKRRDDDKNTYYLSIGGRHQVERIARYLYEDATVFLNRKHALYQAITQSLVSER